MRDQTPTLRFLSFARGSDVSFNSRWVYSCVCYVYFVGKQRPTVRGLKRIIGMGNQTISAALAELEAVGLVVKKPTHWVPKYVGGLLMPKEKFNPKKWWKGLYSISITLPLHGRCPRHVTVEAVAKRFEARKGKPAPLTYLAKVTGLCRRTIQRYHRLPTPVLNPPAPSAEQAAAAPPTPPSPHPDLTQAALANQLITDIAPNLVTRSKLKDAVREAVERVGFEEPLKTLQWWDTTANPNIYALIETIKKMGAPSTPAAPPKTELTAESKAILDFVNRCPTDKQKTAWQLVQDIGIGKAAEIISTTFRGGVNPMEVIDELRWAKAA